MEKVHVLLADDDPLMREIVGGRLAKSGFEVIYATDGNEARDMARRLQPQLVLLDYRMPVFDGLTTAKYLKGEEPTKGIPVILLTNEDLSVEAQKMWSEHGVDAYIHKSWDYADLLAKIQEILGKYGMSMPEPQEPGGPKE